MCEQRNSGCNMHSLKQQRVPLGLWVPLSKVRVDRAVNNIFVHHIFVHICRAPRPTPLGEYKKSGFSWRLSVSSFHHPFLRLSSQFLRCFFGPGNGWQIGSDCKANRRMESNWKPDRKASSKLQTEAFVLWFRSWLRHEHCSTDRDDSGSMLHRQQASSKE